MMTMASGEMLDIITTSVSSDWAEIFYWGNFKPKVQDAIAAGQSITSIIKSNAPSTRMAIKKSIEAFEKIP